MAPSPSGLSEAELEVRRWRDSGRQGSLYLAHQELTGLPFGVRRIRDVQELVLSENPLVRFPMELVQLGTITNLEMYGCELAELPPEFGQLSTLKELEMAGNMLKRLPEEFGNLGKLEKLDVSNNDLEELPAEFGQLSSLRWMDMSCNKLKELPEEFGLLTKMFWLNLSDNELKTLPKTMGKLVKLKGLHLSSNELRDIPLEIGKLGLLETLDLGGNHLCSLPEELQQLSCLWGLYIYRNEFTHLPAWVGSITSLHSLSLHREKERNVGKLPALPQSWAQSTIRSVCLDQSFLAEHEIEHESVVCVWTVNEHTFQEAWLPLQEIFPALTRLDVHAQQGTSLQDELAVLDMLIRTESWMGEEWSLRGRTVRVFRREVEYVTLVQTDSPSMAATRLARSLSDTDIEDLHSYLEGKFESGELARETFDYAEMWERWDKGVEALKQDRDEEWKLFGSLQHCCRLVVRAHVKPADMDKLGLPGTLVDFLRKSNYCS